MEVGTEQPAIRPESKLEGGDKPQPCVPHSPSAGVRGLLTLSRKSDWKSWQENVDLLREHV